MTAIAQLQTLRIAHRLGDAGFGDGDMSAARMTYLIIIPALITMLVPAIGVALPRYLASRMALDIGLFASISFIISYAAGVVWLALRDHRRISAKYNLPER